jgi:hypothetical protein
VIEDFYDSTASVARPATTQDELGAEVREFVPLIPSVSCRITTRGIAETDEHGKRTVRRGWIMYCAANMTNKQITELCQVTVNGDTFEVLSVSNPGLQDHHLEIDLLRVE